MSDAINVHKGRFNRLEIRLNADITGETYTSQIRTHPQQEATLIATWTVTVPDPTNGVLVLTMDETISGVIEETSGYMDLKRVAGGEPYAVFDNPVEVLFVGSVTG